MDEVVVVDTGSNDGTPELARAAGARVLEEEWPGDLGSAHSLPVVHARGDWVLALDADEVLDPGARERVRQLAGSGAYDAYELPVRNYQYGWPFPKWRPCDPRDPLARGAIGFVPTSQLRLFRRRREYAYSGRVHQTVAPAIVEHGGRIGPADVAIHHYGFLRVDRDKSELYARLTRRQATENPDDPRAWIDLGIVLAELRRLPAAADAFRRARSLGDRAAASFHLGATMAELGRAADGAALLQEAVRHNADDGNPFYDRADAFEALAVAHEDAGRSREAEDAYRSALRLRPDSPGALNNLAALLGGRGAFAETEDLVDRLLERYRGSSTAWSALGLLRLRRGELEAARRALESAVEVSSSNVWALMNLGVTHARSGHPRKAGRAYAAARERLGEDLRSLDFERRIPRRYRRPPPRIRSYGPGLVAGVIQRLEGGAGRVCVDGFLALEGRPRLVLCCETGAYSGLGLRAELEAGGVDVLAVPAHSLQLVLERVRPSLVLHHWWNQSYLRGPVRVGDERWLCVGHIALPMPFGYDHYLSPSAFHRALQGHLPGDRVTLVPNGVDVARFEAEARREDGGPVTIAMVSRLEAAKFPRNLPDYLPPLERARVLIAGLGGRRYELEPELRERGLAERVRFVGAIRSAKVPDFLARADVGLHVTELSEEVWGMSVHEMLAAGLPVVAEPKGNLAELVVDGRNGFLASEPAEIARRLHELVESPELRLRMGRASRRLARRYDLEGFRASVREVVAAVERRKPLLEGGPRGLPFRRTKRSTGRRSSPEPRLSVLVCATPRSGSSLLCEALANSGLVGQPFEYFNAVRMRSLASRWNAPDQAAYLGELFERTSTPNGVFGAKLAPHDLSLVLEGLRDLAGPGPSDAELLADAFPAARYVWITRADKVRQAISLERANQTGQWGDIGVRLPLALARPRFDRDAIEDRLRLIAEYETAWLERFAAAGVEPVRVAYEEVAADHEGSARRVLDELGIEVPGDLVFGPRRLRRQADALNDRWAERFAYESARAARRSKARAQTAAAS